jgi:hypothetical protein
VIALLHHLTGNPPKAEEWFTRAFEFDPASRFVELKLALVLYREGRSSAGREHVKKFLAGFEEGEGRLIRTLVGRLEGKSANK